MGITTETPKGKLADFLIGDLAVATRHIARLQSDEYIHPTIRQIMFNEIDGSLKRCIERINRDVRLIEFEAGRIAAAVIGRAGGEARARNLTAKQRVEIAKKGATARWKKPRPGM